MYIDDAIAVLKPETDSQYRLVPCRCGSDNVAYVKYEAQNQEKWRVCCFDCGNVVDKGCTVRHDAQLAWNRQEGMP